MAIIFDFNGTMFKDTKYHDKAWKQISTDLRGIPLSDEELKHIHGKTNEHIISYLIDTDLKTNKNISLQKEALYRQMVKKEKGHLDEGLVDYLNHLKKHNIKMTIASASIKENIEFFFTFFHLEQWFKKEDIIFDDGSHDNKITMFQVAAKQMGLQVSDCVVFEDSISGINYAKEAGCKKIVAIQDMGLAVEDTIMTIKNFCDERVYDLVKEVE